jgi:hypothetical protein
MGHSKSYKRIPMPSSPMAKLISSIHSKNTRLKSDSIIVLVCGAGAPAKKPSKRDVLLAYAEKNLHQYKFYQAEQAFVALGELEQKDLLSLEGEFSKYTDCIIIILESPGAFAELGAFAMKENIAEILLLINEKQYEKETSFINLGPIKKTNKHSKFGKCIYADFDRLLLSAGEIEERLNSKLKRVKNKSFNLSTFSELDDKDHKIKMLFYCDLIALFSPISKKEFHYLLKEIYGKQNDYTMKIEFGMLEALHLIESKKIGNEEVYCRSLNDKFYFYDFALNLDSLRAEVVNYYSKYFKKKLPILNQRSLS